MSRLRHLLVVLGDQLDLQAPCFDGADAQLDAVWMAEVAEESTHVWSSKPRIALFLAAMRHHAQALRGASWRVDYRHLDDPGNLGRLGAELRAAIARLKPQGLVMTAPGDWRVLEAIKAVAAECQLPLDIREDRHFFSTVREFAEHAKGRKQLRLEYWYREQRARHRVLMDGEQPVGGQWNFDADNREAFGKEGPPPIPAPARFEPNETTRGVLQLVAKRFASHPGSLDSFAWPVTREQALQSLERFIRERLPHFGRWQDAMWTGEVWLFHSHLAAALNLKLLTAREVVQAAEGAYRRGEADLASTEGFIRQILGWREYVRGVYWLHMPQYLQRNALGATRALPAFFWTAQTDMACLRDALELTLQHGYAHHIQRLMVTGLYALLLGVDPQQVHGWYLSVYVDAVEWVELPNTLGMSQFADGGVMASKPYVASGKYLQRMGNHCKGCRYDPAQATGDRACPYTTLYWDFLLRHEQALAKNPRMVMQVKNLKRLDEGQRAAIQAQAQAHVKAVAEFKPAGPSAPAGSSPAAAWTAPPAARRPGRSPRC
jgi:deoxyribodipyrimidine photolyase-related protein